MKRFGACHALAGIDLAVAPGTVYGLLGPNGAGKTTTVRILATLLAPDAGTARVLGRDVVRERRGSPRDRADRAVRHRGRGPDRGGEPGAARPAGRPGRVAGARTRAADLLAAFGLGESAGSQVKAYSGGMRRRVDLAASLIVRAGLYFLDEPTTGLDPASRAQVWGIIRSLAAERGDRAADHPVPQEADQLAGRIAVIDHGTVIAEGTTRRAQGRGRAGTLRIRLADPAHRPRG